VVRRRGRFSRLGAWLGLPVVVAATVVASLATGVTAATASAPISLVINGVQVPTDVPPVLVDGRTLVPVRVISERLGCLVQWEPATSRVTITRGSSRIVLTVGRTEATVDGRTVTLDVPAKLISGRTLVPIRFVSEALGAQVSWNPGARRVTVTYGPGSGSPAVQGLAWEETPGVARFVIVTGGPVCFRTSTLAKNEQYPDRVVVDIEGARLDIPATTPVGKAGVQRIRAFTQQLGGTTLARIVFDTDEPVRYEAYGTWEPDAPLGLGDLPGDFAPGQEAIVVEVQYKVLGVEYLDEPGAERVVVHLSGPGDYRVWEASAPWRLVIDARRATLSKALEAMSQAERTTPVGKFGVTQVRVGQFNVDPDIVRVVLDAERPVQYQVAREGNDIVVYLGAMAAVTGFGYERLDTGGRLTLWAGRPLKAALTRAASPDRLVLELSGALLGGQIAGGGTVTYGDDLVLDVSYSQDSASKTVTFVVNLRGPATAKATPTDQGLVVDIGRSPLSGRKIVIDPGHGGNDPGAIAPSGVREADLTLPIAEKLAALLRAAGAEVYLTRSTRSGNPDKYARPGLANNLGAEAMVSIHLNANVRSSVAGTETYYYHSSSRKLAELVQARLLDALGRPDGGVRWADFVVVREAKMPCCLVEALYLTNATDLGLVMQPGTLDAIAAAIFQGLEDFFALQ